MATFIIRGIDEKAVHAFGSQFGERYFLRALDHDKSSLARAVSTMSG
jgi:hypothetical protein